MHTQLAIHHGMARIWPHATGTHRVEDRAGTLAEISHDGGVVHACKIGGDRCFDQRAHRLRAQHLLQQSPTRHHVGDVGIGGQVVRPDGRCRRRIGRADVDPAAARRPARLERQDEAGESVRVHQAAFARRCHGVGDRVEVKLLIGLRQMFT